jgi:hypothetical protein
VVVNPWCHGTWMDRDPVSGRWIFGHMGSGKPKGGHCKNCTSGITCPGIVAGALISDSPLGPWKSAGPHLVNGPNCVPFFQPNGTLFFACPWGAKVSDPSCNNQNAGMTLTRAESLDHALAGNYTYKSVAPKLRLGGTNASDPCVNWEGNMMWVDSSGYYHSLAHAFRGQPTQYPLPGCHFPASEPVPPGDNTCTATGGHTYSIDGLNWYISPVAPFNSTVHYTDGSKVTFRARERCACNHSRAQSPCSHAGLLTMLMCGVPIFRAHLIFGEKKELLFLGNGVGNAGHGQNTGVLGADHTFVQLQPLEQ